MPPDMSRGTGVRAHGVSVALSAREARQTSGHACRRSGAGGLCENNVYICIHMVLVCMHLNGSNPMNNKSQNISARLSQDDYDFLMDIDWNGARTQSEKLRELIHHVRRQTQGGASPGESYSNAQLSLLPTLARIKDVESTHQLHSALIEIVARALPDIIMTLQVPPSAARAEMLESERAIAQNVFRLIDQILRMGVTAQAPCIDPDIINRHLKGIAPLMRTLLDFDHLKGEKE